MLFTSLIDIAKAIATNEKSLMLWNFSHVFLSIAAMENFIKIQFTWEIIFLYMLVIEIHIWQILLCGMLQCTASLQKWIRTFINGCSGPSVYTHSFSFRKFGSASILITGLSNPKSLLRWETFILSIWNLVVHVIDSARKSVSDLGLL